MEGGQYYSHGHTSLPPHQPLHSDPGSGYGTAHGSGYTTPHEPMSGSGYTTPHGHIPGTSLPMVPCQDYSQPDLSLPLDFGTLDDLPSADGLHGFPTATAAAHTTSTSTSHTQHTIPASRQPQYNSSDLSEKILSYKTKFTCHVS